MLHLVKGGGSMLGNIRVASARVRETEDGVGYGLSRQRTGTDLCPRADSPLRTFSNWNENSTNGVDCDGVGVGFPKRYGKELWLWRKPMV